MRSVRWAIMELGWFFLSGDGTLRASGADDAPRRQVENVTVVTRDGFRPEEFFGGAQADLIDTKAGGGPDEWAHLRRYDLYLEAAHQGDRALADLWATLQAMPEYAGRTALVLTTDHGRGTTPPNWTDHGAATAGAEFLWIAVLAPGVTPALGVRSDVATTQSQVAATIAHLLGEDFTAFAPRAAGPLPSIVAINPSSR